MDYMETLSDRFGLDLASAYSHGGIPSVECYLRAQLHEAATRAKALGQPCGGNEVELSHLADLMAHLVLGLHVASMLE